MRVAVIFQTEHHLILLIPLPLWTYPIKPLFPIPPAPFQLGLRVDQLVGFYIV